MQSQLSCPLCTFEYSDQKPPRIISMCGHTFCETCIETLIMANEDKFKIVCPEDDVAMDLVTNDIKQFPVNKVLLKIVESNKSKSSFKDSSFDVSKIVKQQELQQDEETKELISAIQQSQQEQADHAVGDNDKQPQQKSQEENQSNTQNPNNITTEVNNSTTHTDSKKEEEIKGQEESQSEEEDENICLLHQKPLEVVCVVDLEKICAKCALFGKHKGHDFKSLEQIEQENNAFYHELLAVYDEKTVVLTRVQKKQTKPDLLAILSTNKQNLSKQVKQRFKKLIDLIRAEEKKALTKLDKFAQKIEKDIDELYNIEPTLIEKYEEWERHSFEKLQIIENGTFEEKLELLLVQQADQEKNIILQGNSLVQKIKEQQNNILTKAEVFLTNMNMKTNDKIFEFVEGYVEVFDKLPPPPKVQLTQTKIEPIVNSGNNHTLKESVLLDDSGKKQSEDDLLDIEQHAQDTIEEKQEKPDLSYNMYPTQPYTIKKQQPFRFDDNFVPILPHKVNEEKPQLKQEVDTKRISLAVNVDELKKAVNVEETKKKMLMTQQDLVSGINLKHQDSFCTEKVVRPTKKKLKTIKVPEKYEKALEGLYADNSQTFDLTNAELGDNVILQICEFIPGTKLKTVKFIRNKLTDDAILKMLPFLSNIITLNLSQNLLTERVLDIFIDNRELLPKVKNIILSLNKIIERKHKSKIDELRKFDITVSV